MSQRMACTTEQTIQTQKQPCQHSREQQQHHWQLQNKRNLYWHRSILRRTEAYLDSEVTNVIASSPFLQTLPDTESRLRALDRSQIQTGFCLGQGAFSEVYEVKFLNYINIRFNNCIQDEERNQTQLNAKDLTPSSIDNYDSEKKPYVIKNLKKSLMFTNRKRFLHAAIDLIIEAKFLAKLNHKNIINIHGCARNGILNFSEGLHDGFFMILDKVDETLSQRIGIWKRDYDQSLIYQTKNNDGLYHHPNFQTKLRYAYQIADALDYMHKLRIIYRDLKPDNIGIVKKDDTIKLFDFGLCRELPQPSSSIKKQMSKFSSSSSKQYNGDDKNEDLFHMTRVGTRRYMAPEVCLHYGYNEKADVYSWTIVLYEMLSLKKPFKTYTPDLHRLIVCEEGVRPLLDPKWPYEVQNLIQCGWSNMSYERSSMTQICKSLQQILLLDIFDNESNKNDQFKDVEEADESELTRTSDTYNDMMEKSLHHSHVHEANCDDDDDDQVTCSTLSSSWKDSIVSLTL